MASVGRNLFAPPPYGDFATALLALQDLLVGRERSRAPLIGSVLIRRPASGVTFRFRKVSRARRKGVSVLSIAASLPLSGGRIGEARVAYGAMAPTPIRGLAVERALAGRSLDESGIAEALRVAAEGTQPATDAIATGWYRREVLPVHLRRLLLDRTRSAHEDAGAVPAERQRRCGVCRWRR